MNLEDARNDGMPVREKSFDSTNLTSLHNQSDLVRTAFTAKVPNERQIGMYNHLVHRFQIALFDSRTGYAAYAKLSQKAAFKGFGAGWQESTWPSPFDPSSEAAQI